MRSLPMIPAPCSLDAGELSRQLARYRSAGSGAQLIERGPRRLVLRVASQVPDQVVAELVAVERGCCPFFRLAWEPGDRRLAIAVSGAGDEPALAAIAGALELG